MKKKLLLLSVLALFLHAASWAYNFAVVNDDGVTIYYNILSDSEASVTYGGTSSNSALYSGTVVIPETVTYGGTTYTVTTISEYAFYGCTGLTEITIPNSVTEIGNRAFYNCTGLTSVTIPNSVTEIGNRAFYGCTGLTSVIIGNSVTTISEYAFYECTGLTEITIPNSVTSIGNYAFYNCSGLTSVTIGNSVTSIGNYAFYGCTGLKDISFSENLISIGDYAFDGCEGLTSITIPNNVTSIGSCAFRDCSTLYDVHVLATTPPTLSSNVFYNTYVYSIFVPDGCGSSYESASNWKSYIIIDGVGVSLDIDITTPGTLGEKVLGMTENLYDVNYLTLSGSLNSDDIYNIQNRMSNLIEIDMQNVDMEEMESSMFSKRYALRKIILPANLKSIGSYAMQYCYNLHEMVLPETVESIGDYAFYYCYLLEYIELSKSLQSLGSDAFAYCRELSNVEIPEGVTQIGTYCFSYCSELKNISLPSTLTDISNYSFRGTNIERVDFPEGVSRIGEYSFYGVTALKEVSFPNTLESLCWQAFRGCTSLAEVSLPQSLIYCYQPFYGCSNIAKVTCEALIPPYLVSDYDIIYNVDKSGCTLYVPQLSINDYKLTIGWDEFKNIKGVDIYPDVISVYKPYEMTLPETLPSDYKPKVQYVSHPNSSTICGALTIDGNPTFSTEQFNLTYDLYTFTGYYSNANYTSYNSLISNATMRSDDISTVVRLRNNRWAFLSFPYNVKVSDIIDDLGGTSYVIRKYSGEARANSDMDNTWVNIDKDDILNAGEGYIWQSTRSGTSYCDFTIPAINDVNKNDVFSNEDVTITLAEYQSEFSQNRSWNLVGNPYPCFYDSRFMEFSAPITIWNDNKSSYEAYSLEDDSYLLRPGEAFFVQRPVDSETITFPIEGRQTDRTIRDITSYSAAKNARGEQLERQVFNINLSDGDDTDRTRFVINPQAQSEYNISTDACKFFSPENGVTQLYTIENGVPMAIKERPLGDAMILLGAVFGKSGTYTLSLDTKSDIDVILIDKLLGTETDLTMKEYTFTSEEGTDDDRFSIKLYQNATSTQEINLTDDVLILSQGGQINVKTSGDVDVAVYSLDGRMIAKNHGSDCTFNVSGAIYIVKVGGASYKVNATK